MSKVLFEVLKGRIRVKDGTHFNYYPAGSFVELDVNKSVVEKLLNEKVIAHYDRRNREVTVDDLKSELALNDLIFDESIPEPEPVIVKVVKQPVVVRKPLARKRKK